MNRTARACELIATSLCSVTFAVATAIAPALTLGLATAIAPAAALAQPGPATNTEVYAIRYGTLVNFAVAGLVAGADTSRKMDVALIVWLIKRSDGHVVLVDAGFYRDKFMDRWKPADYQKPSDAIRAVGVSPEQVTDLVISHVHWDHVDGADLFPNAKVWLQREEYEHHVGEQGKVADRAIDALDASMLFDMNKAGRISLVEGDAKEIMPGITVYTGGKHTFASQYVLVETAKGRVVLASDNAYLYENLATLTPIAQTLDRASNVRAQQRMIELAGSNGVVVPGHDPEEFVKFPVPGKGVARIR